MEQMTGKSGIVSLAFSLLLPFGMIKAQKELLPQ